ncbi:hypothetical protein TNCV_3408411 [Trichonephila clavipes]|nr:hypothetical protein TNCV_3408411 [Trichonephila clavipes]
MSRGRHRASFDQISEFDQGRIVAYKDDELSFREIGMKPNNCDMYLSSLDAGGNDRRRGRSPPPRCITARDDRWIVRWQPHHEPQPHTHAWV